MSNQIRKDYLIVDDLEENLYTIDETFQNNIKYSYLVKVDPFIHFDDKRIVHSNLYRLNTPGTNGTIKSLHFHDKQIIFSVYSNEQRFVCMIKSDYHKYN